MNDGAGTPNGDETRNPVRIAPDAGRTETAAQRAHGRSKADFEPLLTGEMKLLEACRLGKECRLSAPASRIASFDAMVAAPDFFETAVLPALKSDGSARGTQPPDEFVSSFLAFAESFHGPAHPEDRGTASEGLKKLYANFKDKFRDEMAGWRAVDVDDADMKVRGGFVRFLALGGDEQHPIHELGVRLFGAHIVPDQDEQTVAIDLSGCNVTTPIRLQGCHVAGTISMSGGHARSFSLNGTRVHGIDGQSAEVKGDLKLGEGFLADGPILLVSARITGSMDCSGGTFHSLDADAADIGGNLLIGENFVSYGRVRLGGTRVAGRVAMHGGFYRVLETIEGDRVHARPRAKFVLDFRNLTAREIFLGPDLPTSSKSATIIGSVNLVAARVQSFIFEPRSLPKMSIVTPDGKRDCTITLDGFRYEHLGVTAGNDLLESMQSLLDQQPSRHLDVAFRPQPYEQLTNCLIDMGQERDAKTVAQWKADRVRWQEWLLLGREFVTRASRPRFAGATAAPWRKSLDPILGVLAWPLTALLAAIVYVFGAAVTGVKWFAVNLFLGAGHRQWPTYVMFFALLFACGYIYEQASHTPGAFVPVDKDFTLNARKERTAAACGSTGSDSPVHWTQCASKVLPELPEFRPYVYSADLMLQVGPFGQKRAWEPATASDRTVPIDLPLYGTVEIEGSTLHTLAIAQSLLAIVLYILLAKMLTTQIREK